MSQNVETILWAVKIGAPSWQEQIITTHKERIEEARKWAEEQGFDRFRISTLDLGVAPDFSSIIRGA
jgi:hypothetical protein